MRSTESQPSCRRIHLQAIVAAAAATILLAAAPQDARAGTYPMRSCNVPGQRPAPAAPWQWVHTTNTYSNDECGSGGGFGINAGPMQRATAAAIRIDRPTSGPLSAVTIRQARLWLIARLSGAGSSLFVSWVSGGPAGPSASASPFGPPGADSLTTPLVTPTFPEDTIGLTVVLTCSADTPDGCSPASVNPLEVRGAEVTLREDVQPTGEMEPAGLLDGSAQSGVRELRYSVIDQESGVAQVSVLVGTSVVATKDFTSECAYAGFSACANQRTGTLAVDTRDLPNGIYPLTLVVRDAAGNRHEVLASRAIQIGNAQSASPNGAGATGDARLAATFAGRRGSSMTQSYNARTTVRGRLTTQSGRPIAAAQIELVERFDAGGRTRKLFVTTRPDGRFRYTLRAHEASRTLRFQYRPSLSSPTVAAVARLKLHVAATGALRVVLRGAVVRYRVSVISKPIPRSGKIVHLQGRAAGGAWTTFAIRRTNRAGILSGRYRLKVRRPGVRLQFRLRVPKEDGYPYATGLGPVVTRTVR